MSDLNEARVLEALRAIEDPDLRRDIVTLGFIQDMRICEGVVAFKIELTTPACPVKDAMKAEAEQVVLQIPGVTQVNVEMTARVRNSEKAPKDLIPGVRHVIAVASGKGGVGKSTVAVNLAVALGLTGSRVGLMDADIYGPSLPMMMGVKQKPLMAGTREDPKIVPIAAHGVLMISMGFFLDENKAVVWRGPMLGKAIHQLFGDVTWGDLDYLVVDLPPGTGDVPMSLAQMVPISGVVIVMTPQTVAQEIANKSVHMFRTLEQGSDRKIPILGVVENMSGGVFGGGGGPAAAERMGIPFLGVVPLDMEVAKSGDAGVPAVLAAPDSGQAKAFRDLAGAVAARISVLQYTPTAP